MAAPIIADGGWLELAEIVPPSLLDGLVPSSSVAVAAAGNRSACALLLSPSSATNPDRNHLSSVVLLGVAGPPVPPSQTLDGGDAPDPGVVFLHPVLFMFLHQSVMMTTIKRGDGTGGESTATKVPTKSVVGGGIRTGMEIAPLPMLEYQYFLQNHRHDRGSVERPVTWDLHPVDVVDLASDSRISISCIYVEDEEWPLEWSNPQRLSDEVIAIALQGRLIQAQAVVLLSTLYGCVIAKVTEVEPPDRRAGGEDQEGAGGVAYRVSTRGEHRFVIDAPPTVPPSSSDADLGGGFPMDGGDADVPGYEALSKELLDLLSVHGSPAAASGILLVGCAGVGKSRMVSSLVHHYRQSQHGTSQPFKCWYLSVQDLIFQSSVETNLLENVLVPQLRDCELWVLDDLHMLEIPAGSGDEAPRDVEQMLVHNALIGAMDRFRSKCRILGVARSESGLPSELTKVGRLEKTVQMLPPTLAQRFEIWRHIFERSGGGAPASMIPRWTAALASSTSGCVPADICRVYQDAKTRCWARKRREAGNDEIQVLLEWRDLRDAAKLVVPSQLSELDVLKPGMFEVGMSWKEIHEQSWKKFGGYDAVKRHVFRHVVSPWRRFLQRMDEPTDEDDIRNKSWLEPPPGVLFYGPSGTGKSAAAKCLAASLELPMIQVRATDVLDKWLGGSESLLRSLFARARAASPCILFLDEIDSIAANREEDDTNDFTSRILSTLLNEMDGVSSAIQASRVLVMACTNRIESIDSALLRPGRLQEHFAMDLPSTKDLEDILRLKFQTIPMGPNLDLSDVASVLFEAGATGADVEGLCLEVCMISLRRSKSVDELLVIRDDFDVAIQERFRVMPKNPINLESNE